MSTTWDCRKVLAVDPGENQCVGITKSKGRAGFEGPRCRNPLNAANRARADALLNSLDSPERVSRAMLEQLAGATLCLSQHNCESKPWLSQVNQVCDNWQVKVKDHAKTLKRNKTIRRARKIKSVQEDLLGAKVGDKGMHREVDVSSTIYC